MKFEAQTYKAMGTEGAEFSRFLDHYFFVTKFLLQFNSEGFRMGQDVRMDTQSILLTHGQNNTIRHKLGNVANVIFSGRIEHHSVIQVGPGSIVVFPKLLTSLIINPVFNKLTNKITVADSTAFRIGDRILIGSSVRTLTNILGNEFTLDENVMYDKVYVVSLATETVKAIVF